jgi:uncharacterized protein YukJ
VFDSFEEWILKVVVRSNDSKNETVVSKKQENGNHHNQFLVDEALSNLSKTLNIK